MSENKRKKQHGTELDPDVLASLASAENGLCPYRMFLYDFGFHAVTLNNFISRIISLALFVFGIVAASRAGSPIFLVYLLC